ncbi:hypothetical protein TSUD_139680 [Trifolium subterraneum]|uniref:Reverse transcriptase zinc-binding domain-containing protein n=1 Tax=Trifolium subterraneum TaxID=3900 RepID=A0A2Z6PA93_TRISU|nr:hypothetical protein TSUD_139680 [Trifolium subterraneum]
MVAMIIFPLFSRSETNYSSLGWRDLMKIGEKNDNSWFSSNVSNLIGDGNMILFWEEKWLKMTPLKNLHPTLYSKTARRQGVVASMGYWQDRGWQWQFEWLDSLLPTEEAEDESLAELLVEVQLTIGKNNRRKWIPGLSGLFSVCSTYSLLQNMVVTTIEPDIVLAIQRLWSNDMPSKVGIFGWRLLLSSLPTRATLATRGVITNPHELSCAFCFREVEDIHHVLFNCRFSQQVWRKISHWMQVDDMNFENTCGHFNRFDNLVKGRIETNSSYGYVDWCNNTLACLHNI